MQNILAHQSTMDLNRIDVFVRVVDAGSLTGAASQLHLTTSAVSRALTRLEDDLGVRLLHRTTRKLNLTAAGRAYFDAVKGAVAQMKEAAAAAGQMGEEPRGIVRLTAPPALIVWLVPMLGEFLRRYPKISV